MAKKKKYYESSMIREDHSAMANLPQEVIIKPYPKPKYGYDMGLDDTISGIDRQMADDSGKEKKHSYPEKY